MKFGYALITHQSIFYKSIELSKIVILLLYSQFLWAHQIRCTEDSIYCW